MKKMCKYAVILGAVNVLIVILYITYLSIYNYREAPDTVVLLMDTYVKYSPAVSVLSFIFMITYYKKITKLNAVINIGYVGLYIATIWLVRYVSQGI